MSTEQPEAPALPGVTRWRRQPDEIQALHWNGRPATATTVIDWVLARGGTARYHDRPDSLSIDIPGGMVWALPGDWIIRHADGTFWALTEGEFAARYEPAGEEKSPAAMALADAGRMDAAAVILECRYPAARPEQLDTVITELRSIARAWRRMAGAEPAPAESPAPVPAGRSAASTTAFQARWPVTAGVLRSQVRAAVEHWLTEGEDDPADVVMGIVAPFIERLVAEGLRGGTARAEAAEAKLAEIEAHCRDKCFTVPDGPREVAYVRVSGVLAIGGETQERSEDKGPNRD